MHFMKNCSGRPPKLPSNYSIRFHGAEGKIPPTDPSQNHLQCALSGFHPCLRVSHIDAFFKTTHLPLVNVRQVLNEALKNVSVD